MKIKLYNTGYVMLKKDIVAYKDKAKKKKETYNANYESIYSYIQANGKRIVLTADALGSNKIGVFTDAFPSDKWWKRIKKDAGTNIDILKIPHHGNFHCDYNFGKLYPKYAVVNYLSVRASSSYLEGGNVNDTCVERYKKVTPKSIVKYVDDIIKDNKSAMVFDLSGKNISIKTS